MKFRKNGILVAALAALLSNSFAIAADKDSHHGNDHAGGISYDFFDINYMDVKAHYEEGEGFLLRGYKSIGERFYLASEFGDADLSHHGDFQFLRVGLGIHTSFSDAVDGIAELTYEELELYEHNHLFDESGYGLAIGLRALFNEHWEGTAKLRHVDFGHEDDLIVVAELMYLFNHNFGLVAAYEKGNEKLITFGARFQF